VAETRPDADGHPNDDPLRSMRAERVERDDGRYLIYFSWGDGDPGHRPGESSREPAPAADEAGARQGPAADDGRI
jgi:hypothetical protein